MKSTVRITLFFGLVLMLGLVQNNLGAGGQGQTKSGSGKTDMVIMIDTADNTVFREKIIPLLIKKFPEINFISKLRDSTQQEKTIKAAFTAGESVDIVSYWPTEMRNFTEGNMALDLTPYLNADPQWKNPWGDTIKVGEYDGKIIAVPYGTVYPMILINRDLAAKAGVTVKDQWTWNEFLEACRKIKTAMPDVYPIGVNGEWACWFTRNGLMQVWDNEAELEAFCAGNVPFTDPRVKTVFDNVKSLYDNNYLYPGDGALAATNDQIVSAFVRQRVVMMPYVNSMVSNAKRDTIAGAFDTAILTWPNMGKSSMNYLITNADGYFVMSNTKQPDKAIEVLKYLTGQEIMQLLADNGAVVPVSGIRSSDPDYALYGRDLSLAYPTEVVKASTEIFDYILYHTPANYILYGQQALNELEALREKLK
ncbi:MAG: extracellular solute-binding protein [Treponema sp.]|jgi:ABC-type glycerol-3-phosphate transport system substrate-binding protein|nr:extracellular solute-binding protein [Treponema sp.]